MSGDGAQIIPSSQRDIFGCVVTIAEQETGERETHLIQGLAPEQGVREMASRIDKREGDWRIVCFSTPNTILRDVKRGGRAKRGVSPEVDICAKIGRLDLLPVRPLYAKSDGRREMRHGGT